MTAIVAWVDDEAAYLLADTAITSPQQFFDPQILENSSLGQRQESDDKEFVLEAEQKVLRLSAHVMMAFTGEVGTASTFARALRDALRHGASLTDAIGVVGAATYAPDTDFVAVIATNETERPELTVLKSKTWEVLHPPRNEILIFGTGRAKPELFDVATNLISQMSAEPPPTRLLWALVELNTAALQEDLVSVFVGGVFIGGMVTRTSVEWQPSILLAPYAPDFMTFSPSHRVLTSVVDDRVLVRSTMASKDKTVTKLLRCCLVEDNDAWLARNAATINAARPAEGVAYVAVLPQAAGYRRLVLSRASTQEIGIGIYGEHSQYMAFRDDVSKWMSMATTEHPLWLPLPHAISFADPRAPHEATSVIPSKRA